MSENNNRTCSRCGSSELIEDFDDGKTLRTKCSICKQEYVENHEKN